MKISLRTKGNAVILDLRGDWPTSDDELDGLVREINQVLECQSGRLIYYIHDASVIGSNLLLGLLVRAATKDRGAAREFPPFTIVSPHKRIRDAFSVADGIIRAFATEEEALRYVDGIPN